MKTWLKLAAVVAVLCLGAAEEAEGPACSIDEPGLTKPHSYLLVFEGLEPCLRSAIAEDVLIELKRATSLEEFRVFFGDFCPQLARVNACVDEVSSNLSTCRNKEVSVPLMIAADLAEHLLTSGCAEDTGRPLVLIAHEVVTVMMKKNHKDPLRKCVLKVSALVNLVSDVDIDMVSESFLMHEEARNFRRCLAHVSDELYKGALTWLVDEVLSVLKCQHPQDGRLVLCRSVDPSEVPITSVCQVKSLNDTSIYEQLEEKVIQCYSPAFTLDRQEGVNITDLEWLKENYRRGCSHREISACVLEKAALAESCLPQGDDRQFQLFLEAVDDAVGLSCLEDGTRIAVTMREVHRLIPEKGHVIRDCYQSVSEDGVSHQGGAGSNKNMRFYQNVLAFRQCVVEKLEGSSDVAKDVETTVNDVLKKMKCVDPEDDTTVLCETIASSTR